MLIRRSLLTFLIGGLLLISLTLFLLLPSRYLLTLPWNGVGLGNTGWNVDQHADLNVADSLDPSWPPPNPGDDTIRKYPGDGVSRPNDIFRPILLSSPMLRDCLQALLDAPVLSHSEAVEKNEKACTRAIADKQVNQDQLQNNRERWLAVNEKDIRSQREAIVQYLETLEKEGTTVVGIGSGGGQGRGVVMTAGNKNTVQNALVTLRILRQEYNSTLSVQIFSFPGEIKDEAIIEEMRQLGATHHELTDLKKVPGAWKNFQLKAPAIIASKFAEVLYLDSDNVPLRDPEYLFDSPTYKNGGRAVFWPDYNKDHPDNAVWRVLGKTCSYSEWEVESGQLLIDKHGNSGLNLAALYIASYMQANQDFWFLLSGGDKDTFRYAFWALGLPYVAAPRWLSALGTSGGPDSAPQEEKFCGFVMLQYDFVKDESGRYLPLFLHANLLKHRYLGWNSKTSKLFQTIKRFNLDETNETTLDQAKMWVYQDGGMCVDLDMDTISRIQPSGKEQKVVTESFGEVYGGIFQDFEARWRRAGGVIEGW